MLKWLITGLVLYYAYKFMFLPSLNQGKAQKKEQQQEEGEIKINHPNKTPREDRGEFIDYEEVD